MSQKGLYIAVDWGSSNFRAWLIGSGNHILSAIETDQGLRSLKSSQFESYLYDTIKDWNLNNLPIIMCGMVGSRTGWQEVPYIDFFDMMQKLPFSFHKVHNSKNMDAYIISGCALFKGHYDVMRGEETQAYGFLSQNLDYTGFLCFPGTHSKWIECKEGKLLNFYSFLTGELFHILSSHSLLSPMLDNIWDEKYFEKGLKQSLEKPEYFSQSLFSIRAEKLLNSEETIKAYPYLSGLVMGLEFKAMLASLKGKNITFIGNPKLTETYNKAATLLKIETQQYDATEATLKGIYHMMQQSSRL